MRRRRENESKIRGIRKGIPLMLGSAATVVRIIRAHAEVSLWLLLVDAGMRRIMVGIWPTAYEVKRHIRMFCTSHCILDSKVPTALHLVYPWCRTEDPRAHLRDQLGMDTSSTFLGSHLSDHVAWATRSCFHAPRRDQGLSSDTSRDGTKRGLPSRPTRLLKITSHSSKDRTIF